MDLLLNLQWIEEVKGMLKTRMRDFIQIDRDQENATDKIFHLYSNEQRL